MKRSAPATYFWTLDLIRFGSAVLVVLFHISAYGGASPAWPAPAAEAPLSALQPIAWMGWVGVQIFFVLSGFVIAASARNCNASTFLKKRAIRLMPALWISASIALLVRVLWGESLGELGLAFLRTIVLSPKGPYIDGVVWTLAVEAIFYVATTLVISFSSLIGGIDRALSKFAFALGLASAAFTIVHLAAETNLGGFGEIVPSESLSWFGFDVSLLRHGVFFALGILLFQAIDNGIGRRTSLAVWALCAACSLQILIKAGLSFAALVPIACWALATVMIYLGAKHGHRLIKRDVRPIMRPIGLMTYPLYLNHFVLGQALLPILAGWISNSALLGTVLMAILLVNAWLIAQFPEQWVQRHLKTALLGNTKRVPHRETEALA
ncbi:acyltransferase [Altererythrobacter arenosus]|uniref:Acyltransferase n=1 Tax=Altererythrobacter arenosus TaxID=3032592 RepID=A0ABY8FNW4_9SPHN|nr:acyltransferase [Altererythrobacter sp. CAU 1644]WFL75955.1 acyltransferase [Altererythrobacter sp. CAU 1644]